MFSSEVPSELVAAALLGLAAAAASCAAANPGALSLSVSPPALAAAVVGGARRRHHFVGKLEKVAAGPACSSMGKQGACTECSAGRAARILSKTTACRPSPNQLGEYVPASGIEHPQMVANTKG